jgi:transcriptional regulator with XRE-family HTH domain
MGRIRPVPKGFFPSNREVDQVLRMVEQNFGGGLFQLTPVGRGALEAAFRFTALGRCMKQAREKHRVTLEKVARDLCVAPSRLKSLEAGEPPDAGLLFRYLHHLGLDEYYRAWRSANQPLAATFEAAAAEAGVIDGPPEGGDLPEFLGLTPSARSRNPLPPVTGLKLPPVLSPTSAPIFDVLRPAAARKARTKPGKK